MTFDCYFDFAFPAPVGNCVALTDKHSDTNPYRV